LEVIVDSKSLAHTAHHTTRHHRVDEDFLVILEEDFGISQFALRSAFYGLPDAPKKEAIALCEWATRTAGGDPDEAGDALRAWARKHGRGTYDRRLQDPEPTTYGGRAHYEMAGV
jgi:hypothetical protein